MAAVNNAISDVDTSSRSRRSPSPSPVSPSDSSDDDELPALPMPLPTPPTYRNHTQDTHADGSDAGAGARRRTLPPVPPQGSTPLHPTPAPTNHHDPHHDPNDPALVGRDVDGEGENNGRVWHRSGGDDLAAANSTHTLHGSSAALAVDDTEDVQDAEDAGGAENIKVYVRLKGGSVQHDRCVEILARDTIRATPTMNGGNVAHCVTHCC